MLGGRVTVVVQQLTANSAHTFWYAHYNLAYPQLFCVFSLVIIHQLLFLFVLHSVFLGLVFRLPGGLQCFIS